MATEEEHRSGRCTTHGEVEATRDMPRSGFPWVYHAVRRMMARRRPFRCPECGASVETN
jgi:hypothetical protein